jgi:hypothetical protein
MYDCSIYHQHPLVYAVIQLAEHKQRAILFTIIDSPQEIFKIIMKSEMKEVQGASETTGGSSPASSKTATTTAAATITTTLQQRKRGASEIHSLLLHQSELEYKCDHGLEKRGH